MRCRASALSSRREVSQIQRDKGPRSLCVGIHSKQGMNIARFLRACNNLARMEHMAMDIRSSRMRNLHMLLRGNPDTVKQVLLSRNRVTHLSIDGISVRLQCLRRFTQGCHQRPGALLAPPRTRSSRPGRAALARAILLWPCLHVTAHLATPRSLCRSLDLQISTSA